MDDDKKLDFKVRQRVTRVDKTDCETPRPRHDPGTKSGSR